MKITEYCKYKLKVKGINSRYIIPIIVISVILLPFILLLIDFFSINKIKFYLPDSIPALTNGIAFLLLMLNIVATIANINNFLNSEEYLFLRAFPFSGRNFLQVTLFECGPVNLLLSIAISSFIVADYSIISYKLIYGIIIGMYLFMFSFTLSVLAVLVQIAARWYIPLLVLFAPVIFTALKTLMSVKANQPL